MRRYESYKDSGVEWLGEVPSHWEISSLGKILLSVSEKNRPDLPLLSITRELGVIERDTEDQDSNHNFIPDDLSNYKILKKGQFGMNKMKAWQGSYGVSDFTGIVSPAYYIFDFIKSINPQFFHWAIRSKIYVSFFGSASDGVRIGQWDLSKSRMKSIPFIIPSNDEQQKIAQFLEDKTAKIDQAVNLAEKQIALLKEHKQILIQNAVTRGLNPDVPLKDSDVEWIGQVPEHWDVKKITHIFPNIGSGTTPNSSDPSFYEGNINWLQTGDLTDGYIYKTSKTITHKALQAYSTLKIYPKNSLVIAMYGATIGKVGLLQIETTTNQACCVLSSALNIEMKYIFYLFQGIKESLVAMSYGGGQPNISQEKIKSLKLPFPNASEQEQIADYLDKQTAKIDQAIALKTAHIEKLKEYKSVLINDVVTGKVRVSV